MSLVTTVTIAQKDAAKVSDPKALGQCCSNPPRDGSEGGGVLLGPIVGLGAKDPKLWGIGEGL